MNTSLQSLYRAFCRDETGGTGIEYALIAGGLAITVVASVQVVGVETNKPFDNVAASFPATP